MKTKDLSVAFINNISQINAEEWQAVVATDYPFIQYDFLHALEKTGAASQQSGWLPRHLLVKSAQQLIAVMPLYVKHHSYGEYVFDFQWAQAYQSANINYYPKLLTAIPFTPSSGPRFCVRQDFKQVDIKAMMLAKIKQYCDENQLSSWHLLFADSKQTQDWQDKGCVTRLGVQYHWFNHGYQSFDDFLSRCKPKPRKNIRRERRIVAEQGITIKTFQGEEISSELWHEFFIFYQMTYVKRSGHLGYLNETFFQQLANCSLRHSIMIIAAFKHTKIIAAALFFKSNQTLFGRYWGCKQEYDCLHFELCYYQGIDYCISHGINKFDAGAQGEHKIARGFEPVQTYSNHWIKEPNFQRAIAEFVTQESVYIKQFLRQQKQKLPFNNL